MTNIIPLDIPELEGHEAFEVLRVWIDKGFGQKFVFCPHIHKDPGAWGMILADIIRQVAKALSMNESGVVDQQKYEKIQERIKILFEAEWGFPTDDPQCQAVS